MKSILPNASSIQSSKKDIAGGTSNCGDSKGKTQLALYMSGIELAVRVGRRVR